MTRPASGHRTLHKYKSRQRVFTISATGAVLLSAPALPREQEVESQEQVCSGEVGRMSEAPASPPSSGAFVSPHRSQVGRCLSDSLSLLCGKGIRSRCGGKRDQSYTCAIRVSPPPDPPSGSLVTFLMQIPAGGVGVVGGQKRDDCSPTGPTAQ